MMDVSKVKLDLPQCANVDDKSLNPNLLIDSKFRKPRSVLYVAPTARMSLLQRRLINRICHAVHVGKRDGRVVEFKLNDLKRLLFYRSNNNSYMQEQLLGLRSAAAWLNPFDVRSDPETYLLFEDITIQKSSCTFVVTPWLLDRVMLDERRVTVGMDEKCRTQIEMVLMELCAAYLRKGETPVASKLRWCDILQIKVGSPEDTRWFGCALKSPLKRMRTKFGLNLQVVKKMGGVAFKIERIESIKSSCNDRDLLGNFDFEEFGESALDIVEDQADSIESNRSEVSEFGRLLQDWIDKPRDRETINNEEQCLSHAVEHVQPGSDLVRLDNKNVSRPRSEAVLNEVWRQMDAATEKVIVLETQLNLAKIYQRQVAIQLAVAAIQHYGLEVDDLFLPKGSLGS